MRLSRPCFDKPHRCPGWAGGGMNYPKGESRCEDGRISTRVPVKEFPGEFEHPGAKPWRFGRCNTCNVVTWPVVTRWVSPKWLRYAIGRKVRDIRYWREDRNR